MNPASEWFYGTIQQKFGLAGASLASSSEMNQCIEDLGLGSMESIEQGMLLRKISIHVFSLKLHCLTIFT